MRGVNEGQGKPGTSVQSPLPLEAHGTQFMLAGKSYDNTSKMSPQEAHGRLSAWILLRPVTLCLANTKIPDSRRKSGIQHKPYCVYKLLRQ